MPGVIVKTSMKKRNYKQNCALAQSLDLIGERWTLLILRELFLGPKRFKDILEALSGIGTNLLAARLKALVESGVIRKERLPAPAASIVYQLTDKGRALESPMMDLMRWGIEYGFVYKANETSRVEWALLAMKAAFDVKASEGFNLCSTFNVDGFLFSIQISDSRLKIESGALKDAPSKVTTNEKTFVALAFGKKSLKEVLAKGKVKIKGSGLTVLRLMGLLKISP